MAKMQRPRNLTEANRANLQYQQGEEAWRRGEMRSAFRNFLAAAEAGMVPAFRVVGQFYHHGEGVKADERAAISWYRRASANGDESAANNIGCIWRDRGKPGSALRWFKRAVELGDADANLEIAKVYVRKGDLAKARRYLEKTIRSRWATEQSKQNARRLLRSLTGPIRGAMSQRARGHQAGVRRLKARACSN